MTVDRPTRPEPHWEPSFEKALKKAKLDNKPVMIDFWAEWCLWCRRLHQTTYRDPKVSLLLENFVVVQVDTEGNPKEVAVARHYEVTSLPTVAFVSPRGRQIFRLSGFQGPGEFPHTLESAKQTASMVMAWEDSIERDPHDAEALMRLAVHLLDQDLYEEGRDLLLKARSVDFERPLGDRKRTRLLLGIIRYDDKQYPEAEAVLKEAMSLQASGEYDPKILYVLGKTYLKTGKFSEARACLRKIVDSYPKSQAAQRAHEALAVLEAREHPQR